MDSREAVDIDLNKYLFKLKQHWFPAASIFGGTVLLACLATFLVKPSYIAEGKLRFRVDQTPLFQDDEESRELKPLVSTQNPLSTEIEVIYAKPLLQNTIDELGLTNQNNIPLKPKDFLAKLDVSIIAGTDVLKLTYESDQAQEAADVVNTLMRLYIYSDIQSQRARAISARQFISQQLPQREIVVREAEEALSRFKKQNNIVDLEVESETIVTEISKLDSDITNARADLDEAVARSAALRKQVGLKTEDAIALSNLGQSSEIQEVLRELQGVERELAVAQKIYQDQFPTIISLKSRRDALKSLLQQLRRETLQDQNKVPTARVELDNPEQSPIKDFLAAEVQRRSIAKRLESLVQKRSAYERRTQSLPKVRQNLSELERKSKAAQSTYETLLKSLQNLQVVENANSSNARIIEQALKPTKGTTIKRKAIIVSFGILLGAFLATALVPILSIRQQRSLHSRRKVKEIENIFGYPIWSIIPHIKSQHVGDEHDLNAFISLVGEMHRMIQAHPQLLTDKGLKTLAITSAEAQEGKSTIAANLAVAMGQLGQRVLLIDANMRKPNQHHLFELPNELGLSNVIKDTSIRFPEVKMIINQAMKNLDILTSGTKPASSTSILSCERMTLLLQYFAWNYDIVILDTSPLLNIDGTSAIGNTADGMLLVHNPMLTQVEKVEIVKELIMRSEQNIIGMIINEENREEYSNTYKSDNQIFLSQIE